MNIFYSPYQENNFNQITFDDWFDYGFKSFCSLLHYLGYPAGEDITHLKNFFTYTEVTPNNILLGMEDISDRIFFIISGKIKVSTKTLEKNITLALFTEGNICVSVSEFFSSSKSAYIFESKSHLRLLVMKKSNFDAAIPTMNQEKISSVIQKLQQIFLNFVIEHQSNQSLSLDVRIKKLYSNYPEMFNAFTDEDIASFLGVRRESYNRIKSKFFKSL